MARPFTGANVLLLIRDGKANDIESLSNEFKLRSSSSVAGYYRIEAKVQELIKAGLIVAVGNGRYEVNDNWRKIQSALDISLTEVSKLGSPSVDSPSIVVEPYFGPPNRHAKPNDLFVVSRFGTISNQCGKTISRMLQRVWALP